MTGPKTEQSPAASLPMADVASGLATVLVAVDVSLIATYAAVPSVREWLDSPVGLLEWFRGAAYSFALLIGWWAGRRAPTDSRFRWVIPTVAAWGLLDVLRYGSSLFGVAGPLVAGTEVASSAELGSALGTWAHGLGLTPGAGIFCLLLLALAVRKAWRRIGDWASGRVVAETRVLGYLVSGVALALASPLVTSMGIGSGYAFAGRLTALCGSQLVALAALAFADHRRTVAGWRGRMRPWIAERR